MLPIYLALALAGTDPTAEERLAAMTALYDEICLKTFPDDAKVAAAMAARGAEPLSDADVKVTLVDDPGRGWRIKLGALDALLFIELPPYHTCSLRWPMPAEIGDLAGYRAVADAFEKARPGFKPVRPYDADMGDVHVHAVGEQRALPDGGAESLYVFDQRIADPKRRANGETGIMLRFVHQLAGPDAR